MAGKIMREIIIALLICILAMLLFALVLYKFLPSRKVVPEIGIYKPTETVSQQLSDNVEAKNEQIILTYEVTASDLNGYKATNDYVPGKDNPFSIAIPDEDATIDPKNPNAGRSKSGTTTGGNNTSKGSTKGNSSTGTK